MKQYNYKVVGVTFPARDGTERQNSLKELFYDALETEDYLRDSNDIRFEGYDYKGDDALAVFVNDKEIGNIAADKVQEVAEIAQKASRCTVTFAVNGHDVEDYDYIVDRHKNKKDWKESDSFFDPEEADEEYEALMEEIKENAIYSAVLHFFIPEERDNAERNSSQSKGIKEYSKGTYTILFILGIVLTLMCVVLILAKPVVGIIGAIIGVVICIYTRKNLKAIKANNKDDA